jgi:ybaK/ebsC protein
MKPHKTNAARALDRAKIAYDLVPYEVDENDLSAVHLAEQLGEDIARVFKTLVLRGDKTGYFVCLVPGGDEADLKKAARLSGNKSCALIPLKDLFALTGYIRGGCSPFAMKKPFATYIHSSVSEGPFVYVSAGQRGLQLKMAPDDLVRETRALVGDITSGIKEESL